MADFIHVRDHICSNSAPNVHSQPHNVEEGDDILDQRLETPPAPRIGINTLKNEILTDGMQATQHGNIKLVKDDPGTLANTTGYNELANAIVSGHSKKALDIIISDDWEKEMKKCYDKNITPMRLLIEHMPDLAKIVLDNCIKCSEGKDNNDISWITYNYEFVDDLFFYVPQSDTAQKLPYWYKKDIESAKAKHWGPKDYDKDNDILSWMVEHERVELLKHPLVTELLNRKLKIAKPRIIVLLIYCLIFLGFLTAYVLSLPNPRGDICARNSTDDDCPGLSNTRSNFLSTATVFLVILSCISLTVEGIQIIYRKKKYFRKWENYFYISLSTLTISFVLSVRFNDCFCPNASQWQLGSVVIFLAWVKLILLMQLFTFVNIYINMLIGIMNSFMKLVFLLVLLIVSFGIPLFLLFHQPESDDAFGSVSRTLLKSLIMTTGELDFNDNFIERDVFYPFLYAFWIIFVIVMPVLFNNLLVGLAVGDIGEELRKATLTKFKMQVGILSEFEEMENSNPVFQRFFYNEKSYTLTKSHSRLKKMFCPSKTFKAKVKAVKDLGKTKLKMLETYQLYEQENNEICLLKELIEKGFKRIENLSFHSQKKSADSSTTSTGAEDSEGSRSEATSDDVNNDTEN